MKTILQGVCVFFLLFLFSLTSFAETTDVYIEQQLEAGGAIALWDQMDANTRDLFEKIGVVNISDLLNGVDTAGLLKVAEGLLAEQGRAPFAVMGMLLAAVVFCAYAGGWKESLGSADVNGVYQMVCTLAVCTVSIVPFTACIQTVNQALSSVAVFMGSFAPVYVAVLAAGGNLAAAASYQTVLLLVSQLLGFLTGSVLLSLLLAALVLGIVNAVTANGDIGKIGEMLLKLVTWTLVTVSAVFTTILTVNGALGTAADGLGNRIAKLSIAGMVPVVGGALSEAFLTVKGCIGVVRTTIGAFGTLSTVLVVLPAVIQCVCWQLCLWVCVTVADVFNVKGVGGLLKTMQTVCKHMVALLAISGLFMMIATVVVSKGTV